MVTKTNFSPQSYAGRLWQDMLTEVEGKGESTDAFVASVNCGYLTGEYPKPIHRVNDPQMIEEAEVLEAAYADPRFYKFLVKQGLPVPFAMDDFDPATDVDRKWREKIIGEVKSIKAQLLEERGMKEDTDPFRRELALRIYRFIEGLFPKKHGDCAEERVDWKALEEGCGFCSELSSVLYFAYRTAGLEPRFIETFDSEPTVFNYVLSESGGISEATHVLVGVPMKDKTLLEADLSMQRFGKHEPFPRPMTPRQFAAAHLKNLDTNFNKHGFRSAAALGKVLPEDPQAYIQTVVAEAKNLSVLELVDKSVAFKKRFGESAMMQYLEAKMRYFVALAKGRPPPNLVSDLFSLVEKDPEGSVQEVLLSAGATIEMQNAALAAAKTEEERKAISANRKRSGIGLAGIVETAVRARPNFLAMVAILRDVEKERRTPWERVLFYRDLVRKHPKHHAFRYLLAQECLEVLKESINTKHPHEHLDEARKEAKRQIEKLQRMEPNQPLIDSLQCQFAILIRDNAMGLEFGKRILESPTEKSKLSAWQITDLVLIGLHAGDVAFMRAAHARLQKNYPRSYAKCMQTMLTSGWGSYYMDAGGLPLPREEFNARADMVHEIIRLMKANGVASEKLDAIRRIQGLASIFFFGAPVETAKSFLDEIEHPDAEIVQDRLLNVMKNVSRYIGTRNFEENAEDLGLVRLQTAAGLLTPGNRKAALPAYLELAERAFDCDEPEVGKRAVWAALELDAGETADAFLRETVATRLESMEAEGNRNSQSPHEKRAAYARQMDLLEPLWERSGLLPDESVHRLEEAYAHLAARLEKAGDKDFLAIARERAGQLAAMCKAQ